MINKLKKIVSTKSPQEITLASLDIGNTRAKVLIGKRFATFDYGKGWDSHLIEYLIESASHKPLIVGYSSVNDSRLKKLKLDEIMLNNIFFINALHIVEHLKLIDYKQISGIGSDRIIGMATAALDYNLPLITIDCGTAITINVLDAKKKCRGGVIFPGISTQAKSLFKQTEKLSEITIKKTKKLIGKNTSDAITSGILHSSAAAIMFFINETSTKVFKGTLPSVVLTGGDSKLILSMLAGKISNLYLDEKLILNGILKILQQIS